jgi:hemoglobin
MHAPMNARPPHFDEDRPMTLNARSPLRAQKIARAGIALLPFALAGCAVLFPPHRGTDGHGGAAAAPPAASTPDLSPAANASATRAPLPSGERRGKESATLYTRLGGGPGITAFTDDVLGRVTNDPVLIPFFKGLTDADLTRIRQHFIELLCSATGGGCTYTGKDMKTVHKDMEINNDTWNAFTGHLNETVTRFHIRDRERNELVVIVQSLKKDIVNR